jgi:type IV pilus assembly protein PilX
MIHRYLHKGASASKQRGIALFLVLIFLVILTLVGVFAIQGVTLNERVARNQIDRNIAFQAAEAALRDAERDISALRADGSSCTDRKDCRSQSDESLDDAITDIPDTPGQCTNTGLCFPSLQAAASQVWESSANWDKATVYGTYTGAKPLASVEKQPQYLIEYGNFPDEGIFYQITARGFGVNEQTQVTLQSTFKRK